MIENQPHIQLSHNLKLTDAVLVGDPSRLNTLSKIFDKCEELEYNREFRSIKGNYKGKDILGISTGIGAPSTCIVIEELKNIGIKQMIRVGSAGAYQKSIKLGELIIGEGAVRCDGITEKYIPKEYPAIPSFDLLKKAHKYARDAHYGIIRSHDGFYMDNNEEVEHYWSQLGIIGADMESSTLLTIGRIRGIRTLSILNNVVMWEKDLSEGVNELVNCNSQVMEGELNSLKLALDILTD